MGVPTHFAHFWSSFLVWGYQHSFMEKFFGTKRLDKRIGKSDGTSEMEKAMVRANCKK